MSPSDRAPLRWGLVGPGGIAGRFAAALEMSDGGVLHAVASRNLTRAERFAADHGAAVAVGSDEELFGRSDVDAVYVAVPHSSHCRLVVDALQAGKHVLCEKPMGISGAEVRLMAAEASAAGRFLMEGMWSRFLPSYRMIAEVIGDGRIGREPTTPLEAIRRLLEPGTELVHEPGVDISLTTPELPADWISQDGESSRPSRRLGSSRGSARSSSYVSMRAASLVGPTPIPPTPS